VRFKTTEDFMYAVIRTGGKQYKVAPQDVLQIEKIEGSAGDAVNFPDVLMVAGEGEPDFGAPLVSGALVSAEVLEQARGPKIIVFKKKRRQNYRRKKGHRQELTTVRILEILTGGRSPARTGSAAKAGRQSEHDDEAANVEPETTRAKAEAPRKARAKKAETSTD
jgi:large subunit ribosomal protein L21